MVSKRNLKPGLLAITTRGDIIETLHQGWICVISKNKKIIYQKGNIRDKIFLRSSTKPIQAISVTDNNLKVSPIELAIICASHSGSQKHLEILSNLIKKNNLHLSDIKCGIHFPFDEKERNRLLAKNLNATPLHNNCSGKHIGMLLVCKKNQWDLKTYLKPDHPLQKIILSYVKELSEINKISIAIDGCGVPTFALPVINIAKMFSNFTNPLNQRYSRIISAMAKNPYFAGGTNQIDTEIIKNSNGRLIAKVGAEGIIVVAYNGNCAVVKIADGSSRARSFIILKLLLKFGWLKEKEIKYSILEEILHGEIKNHAGRKVGKIIELINR